MKAAAHWEKIGLKPHHGIAIPLSSLHTKQSSGIGEFLDLIPLIDFCKSIHFDTIQLLPINDTDTDQSPYNAISSCALDPVYISLASLPDAGNLLEELPSFQEFNQLERVMIFEVKQKKIAWLYRYFQLVFPTVSKENAYQDFIHDHHQWLTPYVQFKSLKTEYKGTHWRYWPIGAFHTTPADADFYSFLQFLCFSQIEKVRAYATEHGCFLQGDVPILLSSDSADVWADQHLFLLDLSAGAPPDYYNQMGQKWGFPLFNWDAMRKEQFAWWKQRLSVIGKLYHIYRVDHVVGFFRIWAIPQNLEATEGHFIPQDPSLWESQGREFLLMMLEATPLLPIGEDLGTIPKEVGPVLKELGICGTKVIRWERRWNEGKEFIPLNEYEPLSVTTISTSDSDTLAMWWEKCPEESRLYAEGKKWPYHEKLSQQERFSLLRDAHHSTSYFHINLLQEYLALFPELISSNPEDERINIPGTILPTNWTYRCRPSIEEMSAHASLTEMMKQLLSS